MAKLIHPVPTYYSDKKVGRLAKEKTRQAPLAKPNNTQSSASFKAPLHIQDLLHKTKKRKPILISQCQCKKKVYEDSLLMCEHGIAWLTHVENRTDLKLDYARAKETYERV